MSLPKSTIHQEPDFQLTRITSYNPPVVTKEFALDEQGKVQKTVTASVYSGLMERKDLATPAQFCELLSSLTPNQCLVYGITGHDAIKLMTQKEWEAQDRPADALPRTNESFYWPKSGGILMLDYDPPKDGSAALSREELTKILHKTLHLDAYSHVWWPSTSSCIYEGDQERTGIKGQRFYYFVSDASDLERAAKILNERLWAHGYGHYEVSKSGALLEKGLFDTSVWQPSRIDFAAGAKCIEPLHQDRGVPQPYQGFLSDAIDTAQEFRSLSAEEQLAATQNKKIAKEKRTSEANVIRQQWAAERAQEFKARTPEMENGQIEVVIHQAVERRQLLGDWILTVIAQGKEFQVTVAEVLSNPDRFHGMKTLDPIEADYDGRRVVGKLFLKGARPRLYSFAHGGASYKLVDAIELIELINGKEYLVVDQLLSVLRKAPDVFEHGTEIVAVLDGGQLMPLNEHALRYFVGSLAQFWEWKKRNDGLVQVMINPPGSVLKTILGLGGLRKLKQISAVITAPTLRLDGSILDEPGYDEATQVLYEPEEITWPIPMRPSREQASQALATLMLPFENFPFVEPLDRAVLLTGLLTAAVRPVLPTAPAFGFDAPVQGSGKTLLAKCLGVLTNGQEPAVWPHTAGRDDEETRKRLFAALREGKSALVWDNVVGAFDSVSMAALLTSTIYMDRILSESKVSSVPNRTLMLLTGNNLTLKGDMARRVLVARIDPNTDKPFAREFSLDPYRHCLIHRQQMIACALTLIRFYLRSKVEPPGKGRTASFEDWDDMVRQTVLYIHQTIATGQYGDVMDKMMANQLEDPEQEILGEFLTAWYELFRSEPITATHALEKIKAGGNLLNNGDSPEDQLYRAIREFNPHFNNSSKSFGMILKYRKGRVCSGLKLTTCGQVDKTTLWSVQVVDLKEVIAQNQQKYSTPDGN